MKPPAVLDLSHWNNVRDFGLIAAAGVVGIIHKASEGVVNQDPTYARRREAAEDNGLLWGAYHFIRPGNILMQVDYFLRATDLDDDTLLAVDYEDRAVSLDNLKQFMKTIVQRTGRLPVLYAGNVLKEHLGENNDEELAQYKLWIAQYAPKPVWPVNVWPMWWLWQYTSSGIVSGVNGSVDLNDFQGPAEDLTAEWTGKALTS